MAHPEALGEPLGPTLQQHLLEDRLDQDVRATMDTTTEGLAALYNVKSEDMNLDPKAREAALMYTIAEHHLFEDEAEEAFMFGSDALQMFQKLGDSTGVSDALRVVVGTYRAKGLPDEAAKLAQEELERCRGKKDKRGEGSMLMALSEAKLAQDKPEEAQNTLAEATIRFKEAGEKKLEAESLLVLLRTCAKKNSLQETLQAGRDSLALFQEVKDQQGEGKAWLGIAAAHIVAGALNDGREAADQALVIFKEAQNKKLEVAALLMLADVYLMKEWARQSIEVAQRALNICREIKYGRGHAIALNTLVFALTAKGDTKEARRIAEEGLQFFTAIGYIQGRISAHSALVHVYLEKDEPDLALKHAEEELQLLRKPEDRKRRANMLLTTALIQVRRAEGSEAVDAATEASKAFKDMEDRMGEGVAAYVLIYANLAYEDFAAASTSAAEACAIFRDNGDKRWEAGTLLALSACKAGSEEDTIEDAILQAAAAQSLYEEIGDKKGWAAAELHIAQLHLQQQSAESALRAADAALETLKAVGHKKGQACAMHMKAKIQLANDELELALQLEMDARRCCRRVEDRKGEVILLQTITHAYFRKYTREVENLSAAANTTPEHGRLLREANRKAFKAARDALGLAKRNDNRDLMGTSLSRVTRFHLINGKYDLALKTSKEAMEYLHEVNNRFEEAQAMAYNAEALMMKGDKEEAATVCERAHWLAKTMSNDAAQDYAAAVHQAIFAEQLKQQSEMPAAITQGEVVHSGVTVGASAAVVPVRKPALDFKVVYDSVFKHASETAGGDADDIHGDSPLMDVGMDSLSSVAFRNSLARELDGVKLPASLMFDYPTINQITDFIVEESANSK